MIRRVDDFIRRAADSYRPDQWFLAVLRVAYAGWILLFPVDIMWIASIPNGFLRPRPGLFGWITDVPSAEVLLAISIVRVLLAVLLALGIMTVPVSVVMSACLIVVSGLSYSFSKVDHFILFELVPVFLAFAGWGTAWSFDAIRRRRRGDPLGAARGMPVLLFALTIGWAMLSAAVPKVLGGWLDPDRQATRGYLARDVATAAKTGPFADWMLTIDSDLFWKFLDYATILAEGALILFALTPILFRCWVLLLGAFHVGVYLTLGISFIDYVMVYAVFFSPVVMWLINRVSLARGKLRRGPAESRARSLAEGAE
ncbi:hypothetical protein LQ938_02880 [Microbacterium sp. cx-55]|uniref:hypothetical protein n=1 Tax=Microbacterium sp. cx-55 TaxID=2875948 RepID=UPI001CBD4865|nr:hypothetical protein [Microbacterium sp. cx-55]MBZ4486833.1 hypothetical protein [Microbacterium sp. cx-55]UGB35762.1 hypothetical protein LQ938_02880 [Microbacterium sp. cx-55]